MRDVLGAAAGRQQPEAGFLSRLRIPCALRREEPINEALAAGSRWTSTRFRRPARASMHWLGRIALTDLAEPVGQGTTGLCAMALGVDVEAGRPGLVDARELATGRWPIASPADSRPSTESPSS